MTTREGHIAAALEEEIRECARFRSWYRAHRQTYRWPDLERENALRLRLLFSIRRDGIRAHREEQRRIDAAMRAHREAVEAAEWAEAARTGQYPPDVPLAVTPDPGDHYVRTGTWS